MEATNLNPKVSIVIPVYNGANYLKEAIDSALSQTYKNIEIIVVNDGSNDGGKTEEIVTSYGDKLRYFFKKNGGVSTALNMGIREMTGEWFAWLSHDDFFSPDRIEEDMKVILADPTVFVVFCKKRAIINSQGKVLKRYEYPFAEVSQPWETLVQRNIHMCTMTINRSCFIKTGLFNESNKIMQDVEMTLLLAKQYRFCSNNKSVVYLREHRERGTYGQKNRIRESRLALSEFLSKNFTFEDFYPRSANMNDKQLACAWVFLGDLYCYLGAYGKANECYKNGYFLHRQPLSMVGIKYFAGAQTRAFFLELYIAGNNHIRRFVPGF